MAARVDACPPSAIWQPCNHRHAQRCVMLLHVGKHASARHHRAIRAPNEGEGTHPEPTPTRRERCEMGKKINKQSVIFTEITSARSVSSPESRCRSLCVRGKGCNMRGKRRLFVLKVLEKKNHSRSGLVSDLYTCGKCAATGAKRNHVQNTTCQRFWRRTGRDETLQLFWFPRGAELIVSARHNDRARIKRSWQRIRFNFLSSLHWNPQVKNISLPRGTWFRNGNTFNVCITQAQINF